MLGHTAPTAYPFVTMNISLAHIAAWFVTHGLATRGQDIVDMESWAQGTRAIVENTVADTSGYLHVPPETFADAPRSLTDPETMALIEHTPPMHLIAFGTRRDGISDADPASSHTTTIPTPAQPNAATAEVDEPMIIQDPHAANPANPATGSSA